MIRAINYGKEMEITYKLSAIQHRVSTDKSHLSHQPKKKKKNKEQLRLAIGNRKRTRRSEPELSEEVRLSSSEAKATTTSNEEGRNHPNKKLELGGV